MPKQVDDKRKTCCCCGRSAVKGYTYGGKRYCDPCYEDKIRHEQADAADRADEIYNGKQSFVDET